LFWSFSAHATHNRSGSITYRYLYGNTYEFTVKTCTKSTSEVNRNELIIKWGDGSLDTIPKVNTIIPSPNTYDVQENYYIGTHTYTGPGTFIVSMEDPNRNAGVINIVNSVNAVFCIQTELVISPFIGTPNNSLLIEDCPCPEFACLNQTYCYNLSAYDPDGDSLAYSFVPCKGVDCLEMSIPSIYTYPDDVGGGLLTIDSITGTLCWENPQVQGEYNIAIKISEYRSGIYIGSVLQDMQLTVKVCNNDQPDIVEKADTCVFVGDNINLNFTATDPSDVVHIYATGAIFNSTENPAVFVEDSQSLTATGQFNWTPNCNQASYEAYPIIIHAEDFNATIQLSDLMDYKIIVKIPPIQNLSVNPIGTHMQLNWDQPTFGCEIDHYNIYRKTSPSTYTDNCCSSGAPLSMGYTLISTSTDTLFLDDSVLEIGNNYCYLVTLINTNGIESCVSQQVCNSLNFEVPVMTNVSVFETSTTTGKDSIYWSWPKELNLVNFPGPFHYQLFRHDNFVDGTDVLVFTSTTHPILSDVDTFYYDLNINSKSIPYTYRVELFSNNALIGSSTPASSIFLNLTPNDNQLELTWEEHIPWTNTNYEIYRESSVGSGTFNLIGTSTVASYIDLNLINQKDYCYKIKTFGEFTQNGIRSPIENWSQIQCGAPFDYTAPCAPVITISGDCDKETTTLTWTNPNFSCADDVTSYNLYYAQFEGDSLELLATINSDLDTVFVHDGRGSIAGCYYVTAIDSLPYQNESVPSNIVCIDNCEGYYNLPNVFTPSSDGINDLYHPLLPYKFLESVDFQVFNRWGVLVYSTTDPMINWNGTYLDSGELVSDGVYFYICQINEIKLAGIKSRSIQGNITIFR